VASGGGQAARDQTNVRAFVRKQKTLYNRIKYQKLAEMTDAYCDCTGPPWPSMLRLHAGGTLARFYLCQRCGAIREDKTQTDGTIADTTFHANLESVDLPAAVVEQARAILSAPRYEQGTLFKE
jgi:hypothetical protein